MREFIVQVARRDLEATWAVVEPLLQPLVTPATAPVHPVRELHERCQRLGLTLTFRVVHPASVDAAQKGATALALSLGNPAELRKLSASESIGCLLRPPSLPELGLRLSVPCAAEQGSGGGCAWSWRWATRSSVPATAPSTSRYCSVIFGSRCLHSKFRLDIAPAKPLPESVLSWLAM